MPKSLLPAGRRRARSGSWLGRLWVVVLAGGGLALLPATPALAAGPSVTINQSTFQFDPTSASQIHFTVQFSLPVTGFAADDVLVGGTAGGPLAVSAPSLIGIGAYDVAVSGMVSAGTVSATIRPGAATGGLLGEPTQASTSSDNVVTWSPPLPPGGFAPMTPTRLLGETTMEPGATYDALIGGYGGVPSTGVAAVVLNVAVLEPTADGYITAYPTGTPAPMTSNVIFEAGRRAANAVTVRLGSGGRVALRNNSAGLAGIEIDVYGYYVTGTPVLPGAFVSLTASRVLDTRVGTGAPTGPLAGQAALDLVVTGQAGVPATGVSAVVLTVAVTGPTAGGSITAYAAGAPVPPVTSLSFAAGQTTATMVTARVGAGGAVSLRNNALGSVHLVADISGYYLDGVVTAPGMFVSVNPARIRDTHDGTGGPAGPVPAGSTVPLSVAGRGGVPAAGASAAVLTMTVTEPAAAGWITVFDAGPGPVFQSSVPFSPGQTVSNAVINRLGPGGSVTVRNNSTGTLHYVADVVGYFRL